MKKSKYAEGQIACVLRQAESGTPAADMRANLESLAEQLETANREGLKDFLAGLIERIDLTADGSECVIHYRISTGDKLASPRRGRRIPDLRLARAFTLASK